MSLTTEPNKLTIQTTGFDSVYDFRELSFKNFFLFWQDVWDYFNSQTEQKPDSRMPDREFFEQIPKQVILISIDKELDEQKENFKTILKFLQEPENSKLKIEVILIGDNWLSLDDGMSKSEGFKKYIYFLDKIWENFQTYQKYELHLASKLSRHPIWQWRIQL